MATTTTSFRFSKTHWKDFTQEDLSIIQQERQQRKDLNLVIDQSKHQYGKICPACIKPNSLNVDFCTGCSFPLQSDDIQQLPDNVFLDILNGKNENTPILYRNDQLCLFNDKYGVSIHMDHIDVIPVEVYEDVTVLNEQHIELLESLFKAGIEEFKKRDLSRFGTNFNLEQNVVAGYNFPVSVKHLHLHMVLPPFKHHKVFQYPRWHSHDKVISDLKQYGRVRVYNEYPNDCEGANEYAKYINLHNSVSEEKYDPNWKSE